MLRIVFVPIVCFLVVGCGPSHAGKGELKGTITYKGQPVNASGILLFPVGDKTGISLPVPVNQNGAFSADELPLGDYRIVVQAAKMPKNMAPGVNSSPGGPTPTIPFPDKYKSVQTTDLTCSIKQGNASPCNLELKDD